MRFSIALVALVAFSTIAPAAQIVASPSLPPTTLSLAESLEILNGPEIAGLAGYENLVLASLNPIGRPVESQATIPEPAAYVIIAIGFALLLIGAWRRRAIRQSRRFVRRRRRTEREMASI